MEKLKAAYRKGLPEQLRRRIRSLISIFDRERGAYKQGFFEYIDSVQGNSYQIMAATIAHRLEPKSVVDIGCGSGGLLQALCAIENIKGTGFEYSKEGRKLCAKKGLKVRFADLTKPMAIDRSHDLAICLEIAEHLPEDFADQLVSSLTSGPNRILFSAATPGQGGHGHINEQPNSYWIERFRLQGFVYERALTEEIRAEWHRRGVASWYAKNVMVFLGGQSKSEER